MNRWLKIAAGVLLLAWVPFLYSELTSSPQEAKERVLPNAADVDDQAALAGASGEPGTAEPEEEPEAPADPAADKPATPAAPAAEPDPGVEPESAENLAEPETEGSDQEAPAPTASGPVAQLKAAYDAEPRDALWAKDTEARLSSALSGGDIPDSLLQKASCRKTVCRIDFEWSQENAAPFLDAQEELAKTFGTDLGVEPGEPSGETVPVHVYVIRKGYTLNDVIQ